MIMKIRKLFQKTQFGIFGLFGLIVLSTSALTIYTVQTHLSREYEGNSRNIAKTIADASVDILLNRNLATLQSLIDQFVEIQGIRYVYITSDNGEFLAHTFVPGIPEVIRESDPFATAAVKRTLPGMGEFVEVGSPILAGFAGTVHVGMDLNVIALKIQRAIGQQVYLISILLVGGHPGLHLVRQPGRQAVGGGPGIRREAGQGGRSRTERRTNGSWRGTTRPGSWRGCFCMSRNARPSPRSRPRRPRALG